MAQSEFTVFLGYERSDGDNGEEVLVHGAVFPDAIYSLRFTNDQIAARLSIITNTDRGTLCRTLCNIRSGAGRIVSMF